MKSEREIQLQENWIRELSKYIIRDKFLDVFGEGRGIFFKMWGEIKQFYNRPEVRMEPLDTADLSLVRLKWVGGELYPHCLKHGAMNKVSPDGIWRCLASYCYYTDERGERRFDANPCRAGCTYPRTDR